MSAAAALSAGVRACKYGFAFVISLVFDGCRCLFLESAAALAALDKCVSSAAAASSAGVCAFKGGFDLVLGCCDALPT